MCEIFSISHIDLRFLRIPLKDFALKFRYSEKATKFEKNLPSYLTLLVKIIGNFFEILGSSQDIWTLYTSLTGMVSVCTWQNAIWEMVTYLQFQLNLLNLHTYLGLIHTTFPKVINLHTKCWLAMVIRWRNSLAPI